VVFVSAVSEGAQDVCVDEDHGMSGYSPTPPASSSSTCSEMSLLLGLGIAANVAHGLGHGPVGAAVAAWPAVALLVPMSCSRWSSVVLRRHRMARLVAREIGTKRQAVSKHFSFA
jgi:hypothetical protein